MSRWVQGLVGVSILMVLGSGSLVAQEKASPTPAGMKVPDRPVVFQEGPAVQPAQALLEWLNFIPKRHTVGKRLLRLPVVFFFEKNNRLRYTSAVIGGPDLSSSKGRIHLRVLDGRLGISIMDRLGMNCTKERLRCAVWLEGYWGDDLAVLERKKEDTTWPFTVVRVGDFFGEKEAGDKSLRVGVVEPTH